jgi:aspartate/methionine/tyrosine aminotransferase
MTGWRLGWTVLPPLTAWDFRQRLLEEAHAALTPGRDFGTGTADTHARLSYAASRVALRDGLQRIAAFTARLGKSALT